MSTDDLVERLARDLRPAPRHLAWKAGLGLAALCLAELAAFLAAGFARPDLATAAETPVLWWKFASLGSLALAGLATALRAAAPDRRPARGLVLAGVLAAGALAAGGWLGAMPGGDLAARLAWRDGVCCLAIVSALAAPPAVLLTWRLRRGAPTDPAGAAFAAGLGSAAWAALVFVFACPHDDPLYVTVWYGLSLAGLSLATRALLPRLLRW